MTKAGERLISAVEEMSAKTKCWTDCVAGKHADPDATSYIRCCDPRVCHRWREYLENEE